MRKLLYSVALLLACCGFAARARAAVPRLSWVENDEQIRKVFEGEPLVRSMTMVDPPVAAGFPILPDSSTKVWAAATANELVVRFERRAPQSRPSAGEGSSTDWVGVLLDVENDDQSWYEIRLDMKGTLVESKRFSNGCAQMSWSCKPECRIDRKDGAWSATLRIPFKNLGARPATGDVWGFNFVHKKVVDAKTPPGTADVAKTYETNWTGSPYLDDSCEMLDPLCFRDIALGRAEKLVQVDSVSRGTVSSAESLSNVFRGRAKNNAASRISLRVAVIGPDGRTIASKKVYAPGKQEETFALPYPRVRGAGTVTFRIEGRGVDNPVYESKYAVASNPERRVFAVKEPAPGDLMQWRTFPLTVYGAPLWLADSPRRIAADAERLAIPWSKESFFAHLAENRLSPVLEPTSSGEKINELEQVAPLLRRTGLKGVIAHHGAMQLRDALDKQRGLYWGVVFQSPYRGVSERTAKGFDRRIVTIAGLENGRGEALSYSALKDRYDVAALLIRDRPVRAWSDPFGFFTKILADLSDIDEIWVGARGFHYCSVDEIRQLLSSAVRCGATGLVVSALEHGAGGRLGSEFWTAPERWKYLIELQQLFSRGLSAKRPEFADALVVLPTEELKPSSERRERFLEILEAAHVMIGPVAGVWYRFVGEDQIAEGFEKLDWHKVIFLPAWRCGNSKAREALRAYAKAGGTLVVTDPRAVWPGDDSEAARKAFLGQSELKAGGRRQVQARLGDRARRGNGTPSNQRRLTHGSHAGLRRWGFRRRRAAVGQRPRLLVRLQSLRRRNGAGREMARVLEKIHPLPGPQDRAAGVAFPPAPTQVAAGRSKIPLPDEQSHLVARLAAVDVRQPQQARPVHLRAVAGQNPRRRRNRRLDPVQPGRPDRQAPGGQGRRRSVEACRIVDHDGPGRRRVRPARRAGPAGREGLRDRLRPPRQALRERRRQKLALGGLPRRRWTRRPDRLRLSFARGAFREDQVLRTSQRHRVATGRSGNLGERLKREE